MAFLTIRRAAATVLCLVAVAASATAQSVSEPELKAAFLRNFAKFTDWPDDARPQGSPFTFCVAGDPMVAQALWTAFKEHPPHLAITVDTVKVDGDLRRCQLLYAAGHDTKQVAKAVEAVKGLPVFTVGDADGFAEHGGVAQLRVQDGRMRFAINPAAARRARLEVSAKLLNLAIVVKEESNATR